MGRGIESMTKMDSMTQEHATFLPLYMALLKVLSAAVAPQGPESMMHKRGQTAQNNLPVVLWG